MNRFNTTLNTAKRSKPHSHRAAQLAIWIGEELTKNSGAERFAIIGQRATWELIRTALRKFAER